jgi:hypothetical protein
MSTKKNTDPFAKLETAVGRSVAFRDERDAALKAAAAALAELEAAVDSESATEVDVDAAEVEYEERIDLLVELDTTLSAACVAIMDIQAEIRAAFLTVAKLEDVAKA